MNHCSYILLYTHWCPRKGCLSLLLNTHTLVSAPWGLITLVPITACIPVFAPLTSNKVHWCSLLWRPIHLCSPPWRTILYTGVRSPDVQHTGVHYYSQTKLQPLTSNILVATTAHRLDSIPLRPTHWCPPLLLHTWADRWQAKHRY
jgi:hypothetical protein